LGGKSGPLWTHPRPWGRSHPHAQPLGPALKRKVPETLKRPASREDRLKAALKANMARRKAQAKARNAEDGPGDDMDERKGLGQMDSILVRGNGALSGAIPIAGAKNACLTLMPATLLSDEPLTLTNAPRSRTSAP
jgi:hypothetical protein